MINEIRKRKAWRHSIAKLLIQLLCFYEDSLECFEKQIFPGLEMCVEASVGEAGRLHQFDDSQLFGPCFFEESVASFNSLRAYSLSLCVTGCNP